MAIGDSMPCSDAALPFLPPYSDNPFLRPTFDFRQELLSQGDEVEVLEPQAFREEMKKIAQRIVSRYAI